jgi:hypothetical protein
VDDEASKFPILRTLFQFWPEFTFPGKLIFCEAALKSMARICLPRPCIKNLRNGTEELLLKTGLWTYYARQ